MVASQPRIQESSANKLLNGRMAHNSQEVQEDLLREDEETMFLNRVDWIEGTLILSF